MVPITLIRHGQTSFNAAWLAGNALPEEPDPALNATGIEQALMLKTWLQRQPIDVVYTSPYTRALETVSYCGLSPSLIRVEPCLREDLMHACDIGSQPHILAARFSEFNFQQLPLDWWQQDSSSLSERVARFRQVLGWHTNEAVVVFGHRAFLHALTGITLENCEVVQLYMDELAADAQIYPKYRSRRAVIWRPTALNVASGK